MNQELLTAIWERLNLPVPQRYNLEAASRIAAGIVDSGRCLRCELEDMLEAFDSRLYDLDVWAVADYLDAPRRTMYPKPRFLNARAGGQVAITAADAAGVLIFLEQIGFAVDPSDLVEKTLPSLGQKPYLTACESDVFWYQRKNGRQLVELRCAARQPGPLGEKSLKTTRGVRLRAILSGGQPYVLYAKGPRYKPRPAPDMHQCDYCGMEYLRGDPEENLSHRSYHARVARVLDPRPQRKFLDALENDPEAELVHAGSPMWKHHEIYERARQFKREMRFDFIQWGGATDRDTDPQVHGFLIPDTSGTFPAGTIVGACAFRWKRERWCLDWIWLAPGVRRKGILAQRWARFLDRFGDFSIEAPVSEAMQLFLQRYGTPSQPDQRSSAGYSGFPPPQERTERT